MLPEAFLERMRGILGEEYGAFLESYGMGHVQGLRLNPGVTWQIVIERD